MIVRVNSGMMRVLIIEGPDASGSGELANALASSCAVATTSSQRKVRLSLSAIPDVVVMTGVTQERQDELRRVLRRASFLMPVIVADRGADESGAGWRLTVDCAGLDPEPLSALLGVVARLAPRVARSIAGDESAFPRGQAVPPGTDDVEDEAPIIPLGVANVRNGRRRAGAEATLPLGRVSGVRR